LLHTANNDAKSGDDPKDENREANRNSRPAANAGAVAMPVIQQTVLPIAGFLSWTGGTSAPKTTERTDDTGEADQKAGQADHLPPTTLLTQNIAAVNVVALPKPAEIQRGGAQQTARQSAGGVPDSMTALAATVRANTGAEAQDSSLALTTTTAGSSKNGSDSTPLPATPLTGDTNAPVSSSPLAFAARLNAQPVSMQTEPQSQPSIQPLHASPAAAAPAEAETVTAIQTAAQTGSSSMHAGADPNGGQQQKAEQPALSTQSAAYQQAEATRSDSARAPEQAAGPRAVEIEPPDAPPANSAQVRDVRMQVTGSENQRVDVRVLDRGGELRVSVRADDPSLVRSLQDNMADLSTRLDQAHFRSEIWTPRTEAVSRTDSSSTNGRTLSNGNESSGQDGQGRQQNGRQNHQPAWMDDFEETTAGSSSGGKQ